MSNSFLTLTALTVFLAAVSVMPLLRVPHGLVRICGFPRIQIAVLAVALMLTSLWLLENTPERLCLLAVQGLIALVQIAFIIKFTPLWPVQTARFEGDTGAVDTVSILSCNVKMSNRDYDRVLDLARLYDPDILIFMETDDGWAEALKSLADQWPHVISDPRDNTYGMIVCSRYALTHGRIEFQVMDEVPSILATVSLPGGQKFKLHAIHPEPPVPHADSLGRDAELIVTAERVAQARLPCIVTGDLNDVAWSHTTRQFQRISGLLDPRVGRGLYNTFDARYPVLRWPLDHLFHDKRFQLIDMRVGPFVGSDHFPIYFKLVLSEEEEAGNSEPEAPTSLDRKEASRTKREAKRNDRRPIGEDWES